MVLLFLFSFERKTPLFIWFDLVLGVVSGGLDQ